MEMSGEYRIAATREKVWAALNDPAVLKQAIPGCQELERTADNEFTAKVRAKVGPVSATFTGKVNLADMNPPESYTIAGEGQGGAAGFAKGSAAIRLSEDGVATILNYDAKAQVGGKLAQIGSRLIGGTAKKLADEFFGNFSDLVAPAAEEAPAEVVAAPEAAPAAEKRGLSPAMWILGVVVVVGLLLILFSGAF